MKFSVDMVLFWLDEQQAMLPIEGSDTEWLYGVRLYSGDEEHEDDVLYVSDAVKLGAMTHVPHNLIYCAGAQGEEPVVPDSCARLIAVSGFMSAQALFEKVSLELERANRQYQNAMNICINSAPLEAVASALVPVFNNPVMLFDHSLKLLGSYAAGDVDERWVETRHDGYVNMTGPMAKESERYLRVMRGRKEPACFDIPALTYPYISCNVFIDKDPVGMLHVLQQTHVVCRADMDMLRLYTELLTIRFRSYEMFKGNTRTFSSSFILDLLTRKLDDNEIAARTKNLKWTFPHGYYLMLVRGGDDYLTDEQLSRLRDVLPCSGTLADGIVYSNAILYVMQANATSDNLEFQRILRRHGLRCGVSNTASNLRDMSKLYSQCIAALKYEMEKSMVRFSTHQLEAFFSYCAEQPEIERYVFDPLYRLAESDRAAGTEYIQTLCVYLATSQNHTATAEKLYVHRSTIRYRLKRIEEVLGKPLETDGMPTLLAFSIGILRAKGEI